MSQPFRLPPQPGERIDRRHSLAFSFAGRTYQGYAGDTIASALAANGVRTLSRSFKYRRKRGVLTMAGQDANTLVQLPGDPNVLADLAPAAQGLEVRAQNVSGSLERDWSAPFMGALGRFMPVGFYYKAFYKGGSWKRWEPIIRARAGLGVVDEAAPHRAYDKAYQFCDVMVAGGGPAGLAAAAEAGRAGLEVILVDENPVLGGSLCFARLDAEGELAARRRASLEAAVRALPNVRVMTGAVCQGWFADHFLPVIQGNRMHKVRARRVIVATGSMEQPAVFRRNDLPGVVMGSAAQRLIRQYGVKPGTRAVVVAANPDAYGVTLDLLDAGVQVAAVLDLRQAPPEDARMAAVKARGVSILPRHAPWEAIADRRGHLAGLIAARVVGQGKCEAPDVRLACDLLCLSVGYAPAAHLLHHAGAKIGYDRAAATFVIKDHPREVRPAGSLDGAYEVDMAIADGKRAGWEAARALGAVSEGDGPPAPLKAAAGWNHPWPIFPHPKGKDFVDFDEDLHVADIRNAVAEGYEHVELVKRFSTAGMGPSQGRHSALNVARLVAEASGRELEVVGQTTVRPPVTAEKFGHLAGRGFEPVRLSAMHARHVEAGAQMMPAGLWLRPAYYAKGAERAEAIRAEVAAVRQGCGVIDVSTLGGIDVRGPDAAEFLERLYTFSYAKQPAGRARYALMCDQMGAIIDDGVACRLHANHFYVTATTTGVDRVYQQMMWWNAQWRMDVDVANVTAAYAGVNLAGPSSRAVLAKLCKDVDLSAEAFPYRGVREARVAGIPARLLRVGFVGELGYEIHVPASQGEALWDAILYAGRNFNIRPFGVEAQRVLRLEKGHIIVGQDTDAETTPEEADMAWALARKKPFFVGQRAIEVLGRAGLKRKLAGFVLKMGAPLVPEESHLVVREGAILGRVTSVARSEAVGQVIGLAYVAPDQANPGTRIAIRAAGGAIVEAEIVKLPFYDPQGQRQEM